MKVLFYGGCHAGVFRRIFGRWAVGDHSYETLVNYELIASGEPFPFDWVATFDAVVYSPVVNQDGYNTADLKAFCRAHKVRAVCFPWLQWNGYYPSFEKRSFIGRDYWFPANLADESRLDADALERNLESTTERLRSHELESDVDIPVLDFVLEHYRDYRLFVTPDHPSNILYRYVAREIAKRIDISLQHDFFRHDDLLQPELVLPIPPAVSDCLGLSFADSDLSFRIGDMAFSMNPPAYRLLMERFSPDLVVLLAVNDASISPVSPDGDSDAEVSYVAAGEAFIGQVTRADEGNGAMIATFVSGRYMSERAPVGYTLSGNDWRVISH